MVWSFPVGGCLRFFGEAASGSHVFPDGIFFVTTSGEIFNVAIVAFTVSYGVYVGSRQEGTLCEEADGLRGRSHVGFAAWCRYLLIIFHDVRIV